MAALAELPRALRTRVLRAWALARGATEVTSVHTAALDALVTGWHGQGPLDLPGRSAGVAARLGDSWQSPRTAQE